MSKRRVALAVSVGVSALAFWVVWTGLAALFLYLMSFGDGSSGPGPEDARALGLPSVYLLLIALSCLPFMRGKLLVGIGAVAHALLAWGFWLLFHNERMTATFVALLTIPFCVIAVGWLWLCYARRAIADRTPKS